MTTSLGSRLISLDALRGFTIAAMIIVNDPGSWSHVYDPLLHADWNGITPTDYIFPFFLFIVGVSIALAYQKRLDQGTDKRPLVKKILIRSAKIFGLGLFLWLWPDFDFSGLRWAGVLQRIALVFLPCALLYLYTDWRTQLKIGVGILFAYWIIMAYVPVPGIGMPDLSVPEKNWAHYLDSMLLPGVLWQETWDPEGILSTFPSIATGISGMLIGQLVLGLEGNYKKVGWIMFAGFSMFIIGNIWNWFFPINKNIWTSSFVMNTSGMAALFFGAAILIVDMLGYQKWTTLGRVFGANAITSYVLAGMLTTVFYGSLLGMPALNRLYMDALTGIGLPAKLASLTYAVIYMMIIYIPAYILYKKKIFIKV
ncbi:MAG: heparan-alpha-glucosaminide N-acetyltransferase domain-containing protein [Saprospiraceae bacterium]|nr:heparan-alpha-glucosaminide N-acetyltransferase domain-containing protein [Saprospiraceae bacterium]